MRDCASPRHAGDEQGTRAGEGMFLCRPCLSRMRADLRALPGLHGLLEGLLDPRRGKVLPGTGEGLPWHEAAAEAMSQIRHDTATMARWVIDGRQAASCPVPKVGAVCAWLHGWAAWIAVQSWAPDAAGALAADRGRALALLDPMPCSIIPIPADVNWCPRCGQHGGLCAVVWQHESDRRPSVVDCSGCGHAWGAVQWLRLGRDILRHVSAVDAAALPEEMITMGDGPWWASDEGDVQVRLGDCLDVLQAMPECSVDAIVTDPPAGISFMQREWDDFRRARNPADAGRDDVFGRTSARGPEYGRRDRDRAGADPR